MTTFVKSTSITNLDAAPPLYPTAGVGGSVRIRELDDYVSVATGATTSDTYQVVRVPTHAILKSLMFMSTAFAGTTWDVNITLYYSDNGPFDGSNPSNSGAVDGATFFASGYAVGTAAMYVPVELLYGGASGTAGTFAAGNEQQPLWQAAGLTSDPGGYFDIVVIPSTVSGTVTAGKMMIRVLFADSF